VRNARAVADRSKRAQYIVPLRVREKRGRAEVPPLHNNSRGRRQDASATQKKQIPRFARDDKQFGDWDLWLDGEPEFDGAEAGDGVEGVVVALVERDGAAGGDGGDVAGGGKPGTPHFFECLRDLGNVVGVEKDGVFERGNREMNKIGGEAGEGGDFDSGEIIEGGMIGLRIVVDAVGDVADLRGDMANVLAETLPELRNRVHGLVVVTPA